MQRVTNCILTDKTGEKTLLLKKPSKGWWVAPGGKMESGESIRESVEREFFEETGIRIYAPTLRGVFTIVIKEEEETVKEWMMFTFQGKDYDGSLLDESPEGTLAWQPTDIVQQLPMAPGDYHIFEHVLNNSNKVMYGTFTYTNDFALLAYRLDVDGEPIKDYNKTK
ncbi:MAG: 8-oxo-dGTP diphosphatase [Bacillus sp. (in: Bacteria)]|nr:8-oxo-dGTP diphosphatase [Bacillus sp. (in: firmicutes)]